MFKSVPQVYRDCLRLIEHIGGHSKKAENMKRLVERQFRQHAQEKDEEKIEGLKRNAMSGLANYLTMESLGKMATPPGRGPSQHKVLGSKPGSSSSGSNPLLNSHLPPVSDRVLQLQQQIRAKKAAREAELAEAKKRTQTH